MKDIPQRLAWTILLLAFSLAPLVAQTRKPANVTSKPATKPAHREPAPTFDTLLTSGSYGVYGEVRGVGQLIRSEGVNSLIDPVMKLAVLPKEFHTFFKWMNVHADALMTSRMMCASWAHQPKLPQYLCAIEFSSAEEAQKFETQLRTFLPKLMPAPSPEKPASKEQEKKSAAVTGEPQSPSKQTELAPPYVIKQTGSLVLISRTAFNLKDLKPAHSKLLAEDQNFRTTRDRFASDPLFVYFDVSTMAREEEERRLKQQARYDELRKQADAQAALRKQTEPEEPAEISEPAVEDFTTAPPPVEPQPDSTLSTTPVEIQQTPAQTLAFASLARAFMGGKSKWPDAIGAAISFDNDSYNLRVLLVHPPDVKGVLLPFLPQLVSGPAITPTASSVLPAETDVFVTLSLDYSSIHDRMVKAVGEQRELAFREGARINYNEADGSAEPESPFAAYEKLLGINLKDDLIPLLGNEIALSLKGLNAAAEELAATSATTDKDDATKTSKPPRAPTPIVAIAVRDREGVKRVLPKIIESIGLKGAELFAQTERREGTKLVSYANVFAYAFIGDFFVVSTESDAVRLAVDSYLKDETLGSDTRFRNYTRWQPRQGLGQVYMPSGTMDSYGVAPKMEGLSEQVREFVAGLGPVTEPVTYSLSNEGAGPLHELHVPRNVMMLMIAALTGASQQSSLKGNEEMAKSMLRQIAGAQETYKSAQGRDSFGSLDQLVEANLVNKDWLQSYGYKIEVSFSGTNYEAIAVPLEYGKTGRMSYFIDVSSVLRGGDHGGGPATLSDQPIQ